MKNLFAWDNYPPSLNYVLAAFFAAMTAAFLWSGPANWSITPYTVLCVIIFIRKGEKNEKWELGEKLAAPALCFSSIVTVIQGLAAGAAMNSFSLWFFAACGLGLGIKTYYDFAIKPRKGEDHSEKN